MKLHLYVNGEIFLTVNVADDSTFELRKGDHGKSLTTSYNKQVERASKKRPLSTVTTSGQRLQDIQDKIVRFTYRTDSETQQTYHKGTSDLKAILSRILTKPYASGAELRVRLDDDSILEWDAQKERFFDFDWSKETVVEYDHGLVTSYRIQLP